MASISDLQLMNVKHVLFGNQKQANVINESVASIVGKYVLSHYSDANALNQENTIKQAIIELLNRLINNPAELNGMDKMFVMLTAGEQSLANITELNNSEEAVASVVHLGSESSPKVNFRVILDYKSAEIERESGLMDPGFDKEKVNDGITEGIDDSHGYHKKNLQPQEAADWIQEQILKVAPSAFDSEFVDDKSKALYYADAYFSIIGVK